ncbi:MAG: type II toxin-antitoxin system VapC family toxin, partial [Nitrososphaerota archaeon]|nr:type II toxin-antitoxin system VapC family toxin [Nitrososphaerota archaeon]
MGASREGRGSGHEALGLLSLSSSHTIRASIGTTTLAKRYAEEEGSDEMDQIFERAEKGEESVFFSMWNVGELAVVLDKYEREGLLEAKPVMMTFLEEAKRLGKSRAAEIVPVSGSLMAQALTLVFKHHIYVADALQVVSCQTVTGAGLVTA